MSDDDTLGDFEDYGDSPESDEDPTDDEEQVVEHSDVDDAEDAAEEARNLIELQGDLNEVEDRLQEVEGEVDDLRPLDEENPTGLDPRVGVKDLAFDRAKPGAKVYVVDVLAESVPDYYEEFPDAPALDEYGGNVLTRFRDADAVFAVVYVKDSLTSVDTNLTAYPMPESRLTRYPAEEASMVGSASAEFERTRLPGEGDALVTIPCGCGDYEVHAPTGTLDIDVICPECGNHFGQGTASVEEGRLAGAEPEEIPDDAERDEDGEAVLPEDESPDSPANEDMDLERALSALTTHGYTDEAGQVAEDAGVDEEEVYGL